MKLNIDFLKKLLIGKSIPRPSSGTLSGHAAGEPFDKLVYRIIKDKYPKNTYRQYEYLNMLFISNPTVTDYDGRVALIKPSSLSYLLSRGEKATVEWTITNQFQEKQNDTADIIVVSDDCLVIVDVKTYNQKKKGQPPNIISAFKLANMCDLMIKDNQFNSHSIIYVEVWWEEKRATLECTDIYIKELFKAHPNKLYVNWAAALQIQFHVKTLDQSYKGNVKEWCNEYLKHFTCEAKKRSKSMISKFVKPFLLNGN